MGKVGSWVGAEISALGPSVEPAMPDRDVMTVGDLVYHQHAKIIAKSAFGVPEGREAGGNISGL